jgi:hypothetical protein
MRDCLFLSVGKREMSVLAAEPRGKLRSLAVKLQNGTLAGQAKDLYILPRDAVAQPGPDGLHAGLLGGKAGRQTLRGVGLAHAVPDLGGSEDTLKKTVAKALDSGLNPAYLSDVNPSPYNHLGLCAKVSYRWLPGSKPSLIY